MLAIAIDGPMGAGKSTLAKKVAEKLGYLYVDTGACYRGIAHYAINKGIDIASEEQVKNILGEINLKISYNARNQQRILVNNRDITEEIRSPEMSEGASIISALPAVRQWLLETQRELARKNNVVMDGRDIGTVILPEAQVKIFITAEPEERASRRYKEYLAKGVDVQYNQILKDLTQRDSRDFNRETAPLAKAKDAVLVDSTHLNFEETLEEILKIISDWKNANVL